MTQRDDFERVWPWLKPAIANFGDTHRKRHVWEAIDAGKVQLWWNDTAALVTEIAVFPTGARMINAWLAGGDLEGVLRLVPRIEAWAKAQGITRASITSGRPGWSRTLPGYRTTGVQMTKDL